MRILTPSTNLQQRCMEASKRKMLGKKEREKIRKTYGQKKISLLPRH